MLGYLRIQFAQAWTGVFSIALACACVPDAHAQSTAAVPREQRPAPRARREQPLNPLAALERRITAAETSLRDRELQRAESEYRSALYDAWMIDGSLHVAAGRFAEARDAFRRASHSAVDADAALRSLAVVNLQMGEGAEAVTILTRLAARNAKDFETQRLLAQALMANGQLQEAVQTLEEAHAAAPTNPELAFTLASAYLQVKKLDAAERLFAGVSKARPGPETDVLIGRTYRDAGEYDRARGAFERALKKNPRTRRAHYYLGTLAVLDEGDLRLDDAIREFRAELQVVPRDVVTNLRLGMALVEAQRPADALPHLEIAAAAAPAPAVAFHYLGRCQLALDRTTQAVASLRRALSLAGTPPADETRLRHIHYQLALALRKAGLADEAAKHFEEARQASERRAGAEREQLSRYMTDTPDPAGPTRPGVVPLESPLASQSQAQRSQLEGHVKATIARAYLNLGVMHAQTQRFPRAAEFFEDAAAIDSEFPQVQYSLGVAYFNAQQYEKATAPLTRALAADPANADLRRMLALAWFNSEGYEKAAELLAADPRRDSDPSLQYAYGLALVRSDRAAEAEAIFSRLLAQHGDNAELQVVLGQAHAQQGDYDGAIESLRRALQLKPTVADANTTLGTIYLRQGRLAEAAAALKAELATNPNDVKAQHTLATVLDLEGRSDEALAVLLPLLRAKPEFADARYLLGKILLAQGATLEAIEQLEAAVRLSPEDANSHYQLGQAYQRLGRTDMAEQQFTRFRQLKDKRRGGTP